MTIAWDQRYNSTAEFIPAGTVFNLFSKECATDEDKKEHNKHNPEPTGRGQRLADDPMPAHTAS